METDERRFERDFEIWGLSFGDERFYAWDGPWYLEICLRKTGRLFLRGLDGVDRENPDGFRAYDSVTRDFVVPVSALKDGTPSSNSWKRRLWLLLGSEDFQVPRQHRLRFANQVMTHAMGMAYNSGRQRRGSFAVKVDLVLTVSYVVMDCSSSVVAPAVSAFQPSDPDSDSMVHIPVQDRGDTGSICLDPMAGADGNLIETPCKHVFHGPCFARWLETNPTCPLCRAPQ